MTNLITSPSYEKYVAKKDAKGPAFGYFHVAILIVAKRILQALATALALRRATQSRLLLHPLQ